MVKNPWQDEEAQKALYDETLAYGMRLADVALRDADNTYVSIKNVTKAAKDVGGRREARWPIVDKMAWAVLGAVLSGGLGLFLTPIDAVAHPVISVIAWPVLMIVGVVAGLVAGQAGRLTTD